VGRFPVIEAVLAAAWLGAFASARADSVQMPYACKLDRGRLIVTAGGDHAYPIVGERAETEYSTCVERSAGGCLTLRVHRFEIACDGKTVPWIEVAAILAAQRLGRATIDDGRLTLRIERPLRARALAGCPGRFAAPPPQGLRHPVPPVGIYPCSDRPLVRRPDRIVQLPAGYAPLAELGAKLSNRTVATRPDEPPRKTSVIFNGPPLAADLAPPQPLPPPAAPKPIETSASWVTVVEREPVREMVPVSVPVSVYVPEPLLRAWPWIVAVGAVLGAGLGAAWLAMTHPVARARLISLEVRLMRWRRSLRHVGGRGLQTRESTLPEAYAARDLDRMAGELIDRIEMQAARLSNAQPLRRVLLRETHRQRRRLEAARAVAPITQDGWPRYRSRFQAMIQDIVRLRDIVDGAEKSVAGGLEIEVPAPADKPEAYALLGVNPDVSERVLKKLVEALRACWHPDLARTEADRAAREIRIKNINVAWDLITGKRQEA